MRDCRVDAGCEGADLMTDEERIETAKRACKRNEYAREHGICVRCHKAITGLSTPSGIRTAEDVVAFTRQESGADMCYSCYKAWKAGETA